jgi:hypothetical protein
MLQLKSLNSKLLELKLAFDEAIMQGDSFADVKKIYTEIKHIEKLIAERQVELLKIGRSDE